MSLTAQNEAETLVPKGYTLIPVSPDQASGSLRLTVLVAQEPDPVAGHLVVLRHTSDARVVLGAVTDAAGSVHGWIEVWVQSLDGLTAAVPTFLKGLTNDFLDRRWQEQRRAFESMDRASVLSVGWESTHPKPTLLDLDAAQPVHPSHAQTGHPWQLCEDDALLERKQLPRYSTSLHRYLYLPDAGDETPFAPVTPDAPTNEVTQPLSEALGSDAGRLIALNEGGGLMLARPFYPFGFESFIDVLSGGRPAGVSHGRAVLHIGVPSPPDAAESTGPTAGGLSDGWLFMGSSGRWGRLSEALHIKLQAMADVAWAVRGLTQRTQRPLFNLSPDSVRVAMGRVGTGLPFLWTAIPTAVDPGAAMALPIPDSQWQYYLPVGDSGTSIYRPQSVGRIVHGKGSVRIRQVLAADAAATTLEGTLTTEEKIDPAQNDLARLELNLAGKPVGVFAHLDREAAMASGEWRFRTIGQKFDSALNESLRAAEGVPMVDAPFEVIPLLSSPCDMYALGVMAVGSLLANRDTTLAVALDELLSLIKQLDADPGDDDQAGLAARIGGLVSGDERWLSSLGPHRLTHETFTPQEAFDVIPPQLWWQVLAMMVRLFPGASPYCPCRDWGDAPQGGIHKIYERLLGDLETLVLRTRSLIVIDWRFNREVHAVLRQFTVGVASR